MRLCKLSASFGDKRFKITKLEAKLMPITPKDDSVTMVEQDVLDKYSELAERLDTYFDEMDTYTSTSELDKIKKAWEASNNIWSALDPGMVVVQQWMEDLGGVVGQILYKARIGNCLPPATDTVTGFASCSKAHVFKLGLAECTGAHINSFTNIHVYIDREI